MDDLDYRKLLSYSPRRTLRFSEFLEIFVKHPAECLRTSSALISEAIKHFGFEIVVRSGEPTVSYKLFKDPFADGTNAVFGQEFCIKHVVDVIDSVAKESGPNRGIILVGPPASGKTNIVDLISLALEEYTKQREARLYSFYFAFKGRNGQVVEYRPAFLHNPVLLFPSSLIKGNEVVHPRQELFDLVNQRRGMHEKVVFASYYLDASLDKQSLDIIEALLQNPRNEGKTLFDVIEEYVRVEEIDFSIAQAKGIANIDFMRRMKVRSTPLDLVADKYAALDEHIPGTHLSTYQGAIVAANRGLLHIHDAFGGGRGSAPSEEEYKPLLMLLGSGKASVESTQTSVDTTVILTTNLEEMTVLEGQLSSSKLLDRIEEIPVNYLLDANSEMDILRRDMANMREKYDVDPNLLRVAAYYSVLTRLLPPRKNQFPHNWSEEKRRLYLSITPEQKLFIYACRPDDPVATIRSLPHWHPFRSEMIKLGVDVHRADLSKLIAAQPERRTLENSQVFATDQLKLVDDEFMRELWNEHYPNEGKHGMSVRQLQNVMRDTLAASGGLRVHVGTFFNQLEQMFSGNPSMHHWPPMDAAYREGRKPVFMRFIGDVRFAEGEGDYGDFKGLGKVARALYYLVIAREIMEATVNRDPEQISADLRRYLQQALLFKAHENRAFAHIMIPRFSYIDPHSGEKVDRPDLNYLTSIEKILAPGRNPVELRREMAQRFLDLQASRELVLEGGKTVVSSRKDNVLTCFGTEYAKLLSHRRTMGTVGADQLSESFFYKRRDPEAYEKITPEVRDLAESVVLNMQSRFGYSKQSALDTVIFALRKEIIKFADIIS
ncbi:MAG: hypothetical protein HY900_11530 [Deltaproteobacteria bacterium]|nr:hypothetical protein [Deltaproteobacteria bacterium]